MLNKTIVHSYEHNYTFGQLQPGEMFTHKEDVDMSVWMAVKGEGEKLAVSLTTGYVYVVEETKPVSPVTAALVSKE